LDSTYLFGRGTDGAYMGPPGAAAAASGAPEVPLAPYDNVMISRQPGWDQQRLVYLTGQVKFPGRYALQSRTERLSVLIQRAGGLTPVAYAGGIQFYRAYSTTLGATNSRQPPMVADSQTHKDSLPRGFVERVGVDLPRVLKEPDFRDNIILVGGDSVNI